MWCFLRASSSWLAWWLQAFGLILAIWLTLLTAALRLRASAGRLSRMK
jgi:hypothetical protein